MRLLLIISTLALVINGCSKGGGGGGGGSSPIALCTDVNAINNGSALPCACASGYLPNSNSTQCIAASALCTDANASNQGSALPCTCNSGYLPNVGGTQCIAQGSGGSQAPSALIYASMPNPLTLFIDQGIITPYGPTVTNCSSGCTYTVTPSLPSGMNLNSSTGVISGSPTVTRNTQSYEVRATNSYGYASSTINFRVVPRPPSSLVISNNDVIYIKDRAITDNTISYGSGRLSISSMTVSPSLPSGLFLVQENSNPELPTFRIRGTPTVSSPETTYTLTAIGPTSPNASISFNLQVIATPTIFTYSNITHPNCNLNGSVLECDFEKLTFFDPLIPTSNGDGVRFQIRSTSPNAELPSGIGLSSVNGNIFTTQYGALETKLCAGTNQFCEYQLEAYVPGYESDNSLKAFATIRLKVTPGNPPNNFTYDSPPSGPYYTYRKNQSITTLSPIFSGSAPDCITTSGCFSISPGLPSGLVFSSFSGSISGTPQALASLQIYTITANDSRGTVSGQVQFEVKERLPVLTYTKNSYTYYIGEDLNLYSTFGSVNQLSVNNDIPINSFSISPSLPSGLSLNTGAFVVGDPLDSGGTISGVANSLSAETDYILSACNSGGCTDLNIKIAVNPFVNKVVSGERHACAMVRTSSSVNDLNQVICWGANDKGQLGNASSTSCTDVNSNVIDCIKKGAYVMNGSNPLINVRSLSAGKNHTCAVVDSTPLDSNLKGEVFCWGDNSFGQLGQDSLTPNFSINPLSVQKSTNAVFNSALKVESGGNASCIISLEPVPEDSQVEGPYIWCVGENYDTQAIRIGYNSDSRISLFSDLSGNLAMGKDHVCLNSLVVNSDLSISPTNNTLVKCWGLNDRGQLGNNSTSSSFSLTPVTVQVEAGGNITRADMVHSGNKFSCIRKSDTLQAQCWGSNDEGQLSLGSLGGSSLRAKLMLGLSNVESIGGGSDFVIAGVNTSNGIIGKISGRFPLAGSPYSGTNASLPVNLKTNSSFGIIDFLTLSGVSRSADSKDHFCTMSSISSVDCFGKNDVGQLGVDTDIDSVLPVRTKIVP